MNTSTRRLLGGLATAAVLLFGHGGFVLAASPPPAEPQPSGPTGNEMLSVQPALISVSAKPGTSTSAQLTIRAAADLDVTIKSMGLAQASDGSFKSVPAAQDTSPYSARTMLSTSQESLHLRPGEKVGVTVGVVVPQNVGAGTRYAIITITGLPAGPTGSANVGFGVELGVSTIVQIAGTPQDRTGAIRDISVGQTLPGQQLPLKVTFLNTGNTHYGAVPNELVTTATLQDATGAELATAKANGNQTSVIPTFSRVIPLPMTPSRPLVDGGKYHVEVGVGLKDGTVLDRKAIDFTWSGGQVLEATGAPTPAGTTGGGSSGDTGLIIVAALVGAAAVAVLVLVIPRLRRRAGPAPLTGGQ